MDLATLPALSSSWTSPEPEIEAVAATTEAQVRRLLALELHDQVVQELTSSLIDLEVFKRAPFDAGAVRTQVESVQGSIRRSLDELRRVLCDLREEEGWQTGFVASLRDLAARSADRCGLQVSVEVSDRWPARIRTNAARHLGRIVQEAVTNARLHGGAESVAIVCQDGEGAVSISVSDDGCGLEPEVPGSRGLGLLGMRERAALLGASLEVESWRGIGTTVRLEVARSALA
ncbi:MAG: histidine kinase [Candidatus Dormibacteraeota bacterium]|nr:histidine kinase [Candidatus Dormibacteraeota bacterium]